MEKCGLILFWAWTLARRTSKLRRPSRKGFWEYDTRPGEGCKGTGNQVTVAIDFVLWRLICCGPSSELDSWNSSTYQDLEGAGRILYFVDRTASRRNSC
jgi:hypothetical protein